MAIGTCLETFLSGYQDINVEPYFVLVGNMLRN